MKTSRKVNVWAAAGLVMLGGVAGCERQVTTTSQLPGYSDPHPPADAFTSAVNRPPSAQTLYAMGRILAAQGKNEEARTILDRTIKTYPAYMPAYVELSALYMRTGRAKEAIAELEAARKLSPRDAVVLNDLGMCHMLEGDYPAALELVSAAAAAEPDNARYHANRGVVLGMMGRDAESLDAFRAVMPEAEAHYNLAVLLAARKQAQKSQTEFRIAESMGFKPPPGPAVEVSSRGE